MWVVWRQSATGTRVFVTSLADALLAVGLDDERCAEPMGRLPLPTLSHFPTVPLAIGERHKRAPLLPKCHVLVSELQCSFVDTPAFLVEGESLRIFRGAAVNKNTPSGELFHLEGNTLT